MATDSGRYENPVTGGDARSARAPSYGSAEASAESPGGMTLDELLALPVAMDLVTAGRAWRLGRTKCHELARADQFPCRVLRVGNQYRVTRADLLASLGIDPTQPRQASASAP